MLRYLHILRTHIKRIFSKKHALHSAHVRFSYRKKPLKLGSCWKEMNLKEVELKFGGHYEFEYRMVLLPSRRMTYSDFDAFRRGAV